LNSKAVSTFSLDMGRKRKGREGEKRKKKKERSASLYILEKRTIRKRVNPAWLGPKRARLDLYFYFFYGREQKKVRISV